MDNFTKQLKTQAFNIGFSKVGIIAVEELIEEGNSLKSWLNLGYQGTMTWMDRTADKRIDPRLVFPEVRSVISVALNYYTPHQHTNDPNTGKISRYAWGDDYHDVVGEKLVELLNWIKQERPEAEGKICVDAQPAMDKVWAARAGLGWIGKHSNLITLEYSSWVFLGEILVNLQLEYDSDRVPNHCGTCTACIDACPTQAIVEPYVVDAKKCISFATIESKEEVLELQTEKWIFGCDICQDVCPWSRFAKQTAEQRFEPREGLVTPNLEELKNITEEEFQHKFNDSPIKRAKYKGLKRNVSAAILPKKD